MSLARLETLLEEALTLVESEKARQTAPVVPDDPLPIDRGLARPDQFWGILRAAKLFGATVEQSEVDGTNAILKACEGWPVSWAAYALATALHETAGTMRPIKERGSAAYFFRMYDPQGSRPAVARELGNIASGDGVKYAGRGYVQLTGRRNYALAEEKLGAPMTSNPDLALSADLAAQILRLGMGEGWFTGKSLNDYLPAVATFEQFKNARRIINGTDRADEIAKFAASIQNALTSGGWA